MAEVVAHYLNQRDHLPAAFDFESHELDRLLAQLGQESPRRSEPRQRPEERRQRA